MRNITGARIKTARLARHLTQDELAARLQLQGHAHSRNTIAKVEGGFRNVTDIELLAFARALDVSVSWLFEDDRRENH